MQQWVTRGPANNNRLPNLPCPVEEGHYHADPKEFKPNPAQGLSADQRSASRLESSGEDPAQSNL